MEFQPKLNRRARRHSPLAALINKPKDLVELDQAQERFANENARLTEALKRASTPGDQSWFHKLTSPWRRRLYSPGIYRGEPAAISAAEATRAYSDIITRASARYPVSRFPQYRMNEFKGEDVYNTSLSGTSLRDIEAMTTPLEGSDIKRINEFLKKTVTSSYQLRAQLLFLFMPTQVMAQNEGTPPITQAALFRGATSYFDSHLPFFIDPSLNWRQDLTFLHSTMWLTPYFKPVMGAYLPARLGLTPSSIEKRLVQKETTSWIGNKRSWKFTNSIVLPEVREAYRANDLPQKLERYRQFDRRVDEKAAKMLVDHYYPGGSVKPFADSASTRDSLGRFKKSLNRDIARSSDKFLTWQLDHPIISDITIGNQNQNTLILVLQFKDGDTFLTLELDKNNELFGIPPSLAKNYPHAEDHLTDDVISKLLGQLRLRYPEVEPMDKPRPKIEIKPKPIESAQERRIVEVELEEEPSLPRGIRGLRRLPTVIEEPEVPIIAPAETSHKYRGNYTRETIVGHIGRKHGADEIDRIIRTLQRFERGEKSIKALYEDEAYSLRVGDWRIIVEFGSGQDYDFDIKRIAWRDVVYK